MTATELLGKTQVSEAAVVAENVSRVFSRGASAVVAVHGSSCVVPARSRIAIVGSSGSGKSTLLHLLAGLEQPSVGSISWPTLPEAERRHLIGVVFQSPSLVPALTVAENTGLPLLLAGVAAVEADTRSAEALELLGLADLAVKLPEKLSGGQAQRVAVARVLAQRPALVLADEPTGQLDRATGDRVVKVLLETVDRIDATLVVSTHDRHVAEQMESRWVMRSGRLQANHKETVQ